jgi:hypothetical protein
MFFGLEAIFMMGFHWRRSFVVIGVTLSMLQSSIAFVGRIPPNLIGIQSLMSHD